MRGLYIHIPFCVKKYKYCDFLSFSGCMDKAEQYINAVEKEMERFAGETVDTVFIGGGTPTCLEPPLLERLLTAVNSIFKVSAGCEFSAEANPGTLTKEKLAVMKNGGVNRLSIGVQSFNDNELELLGRIHTAEEAARTVQAAQEYFDNINIDLMTAIPEQTMESLKYNLSKAAELGVSHISCYSLIIEDGTPLYRDYNEGKLNLPDEDTDRDMYAYLCGFLRENGYKKYEISNFAKPGFECRHNLKYWDCMEYIGVGAGAHSYIDGIRYENTRDFLGYIQGKTMVERQELSIDDMISEFMIMGLRKSAGVSKNEFRRRFGRDIREVYLPILKKFLDAGLLLENDKMIYLSDRGVDISNSVMCEFIL